MTTITQDELFALATKTGERVQEVLSYPSWPVPRYAAEVVWQLLYGYLRGQVPTTTKTVDGDTVVVVPPDLDGVAFAAALRFADLLQEYKNIQIDQLRATPGVLRLFTGWQLHERIVLDRYRRTTA